jgi:glutaminyl-peptide cyclotransferase
MSGKRVGLLVVCAGLAGAAALVGRASAQQPLFAKQPEALKVSVVRTYPHDRSAFTQGLIWRDGFLYESTGLVGRSSLRKVDVTTGSVKQQVPVPTPYFAEGLADVGNRLFQLTWRHGRVFLYDKNTLGRVGELAYEGEGWGLCHDGRSLVMSNGSDTLTVRSAATFAVTRTVKVTMGGRPLERLNELECVDGDVYANVWTTDSIVRIDMKSGTVTARIDASGLLAPAERFGVDVLNGIAYDPADRTFLITGKLWPKLFRVRFVR